MANMRYIKILACVVIPAIVIYFLDTGMGSLPPLGKLMDPVHGFMANAETKTAFESNTVDIADPSVKGTIVLDDRLVPHVFAEDEHSLYYLQGYITAKYRLWQMDIQTRAAAGRLSELFGPKFIEYDLEQRRKGMIFGAENALATIKNNPKLEACIQAYTDGVNAFMRINDSNGNVGLDYAAYPIEFKLLNYEPEAWTPLKTALLLKYMASTLTGFDDDAEMTNLKKLLADTDFNALYPDYTTGIDPIIPTEKIYDFDVEATDTLASTTSDVYYKKVLDIFEQQHQKNQVGSNNWAVGGSKTKNGYPILCNDPHLQLNLPSLWFEIQLQLGDMNCYGASLPGAPAIVIGFNDDIAWGVTNAQVDVRDWYTITYQDETKAAYKYGNEWRKTTKRIETVNVRGASAVVDTVIYTHYGPVVYENVKMVDGHKAKDKAAREGMAMRWLALEKSEEVNTFYLLNRAKNYDDYRHAISYFSCPAQNFIFASHSGDIAITQQGRFPLKHEGQGKFILDGTNPADDYQGYIPFEHNPTIKNPSRGFCASANQHPTDSTYPYYYTSFDFEFYRNRVINTTLNKITNATITDMQNLQQNNFNLSASEALPILLTKLSDPCRTDENACKIVTALKEWNYENNAVDLAPTYYQIWWDTLYNLMWDEMQSETIAYVKPNTYFTVEAMRNFPDNHPLFDFAQTADKKETFADLVQQSFTSMLSICDSLVKADKNVLQWYQHKHTNIMHISQIPAFSKLMVNNGGYRNIVNATSETHGPSWRMIVELSSPVNAFGIYPGGQSGNPGSKYYDNFVDDWAAGKYYPLYLFTNLDAAGKKALFTLTFN
jgi:penicillin amidase